VRRLFLAACSLATLVSPAVASTPDWFHSTIEDSFSLDLLPAGALDVSESRLAAARTAGRAYIDLIERHELYVAASEELTLRRTLVRRLLNQQGVESYGNERIGVRPSLEDLTVEAAFTITDGHLEPLEAESIQFLTTSGGDIFSDAQEAVLPFKGVAPDSTLVSISTRQIHAGSWPLPWSQLFAVRGLGPIERFEVEVHWDEGVPAPSVASNDRLVSCTTTGNRRVSCSRFMIEPFELDPAVAWSDVQTYVAVGEPQTWEDLVRAEAEIVASRVQHIPLNTVAGAHDPPSQKLRAIYRFVSDEIRYVGFEHGTGAVVPRHARTTLERRFGDCKDKVTLFLSLALAAGLDAYPVLVSSQRYDPRNLEAPSWRWFDHMIACVDGIESEPVCLELTTRNADVGELPSGLHGAVALDLRSDRGAVGPRQLGIPRKSWPVEVSVENLIDCDSNIAETVTLEYHDAAAIAARDALRGATNVERTRWAEETYAEVIANAATPKFEFSGIDDPASNVMVRAVNEFPSSEPLSESTHVSDADFWLDYLARNLKTGNRHHPYRATGTHIRSTVKYHLCEGVLARLMGAELDLHSEFGSLTRHYRRNRQTVSVTTTLEVGANEIAPSDLERYNRFLEQALDQSSIWFSLEAAEPPQ
jgi:hypothetical protein